MPSAAMCRALQPGIVLTAGACCGRKLGPKCGLKAWDHDTVSRPAMLLVHESAKTVCWGTLTEKL